MLICSGVASMSDKNNDFKYKIWISAGNLKCFVLTKSVSSGILVSLYTCSRKSVYMSASV